MYICKKNIPSVCGNKNLAFSLQFLRKEEAKFNPILDIKKNMLSVLSQQEFLIILWHDDTLRNLLSVFHYRKKIKMLLYI